MTACRSRSSWPPHASRCSSPDELLTRLDKRLPLLASRSRDAPAGSKLSARRSSGATSCWSRPSRSSSSGLAVFRGSFALEAAESICGADLDILESLVVKSLVRRLATGRLRLLDTIREYAVELLDEAPDDDGVRRRHADYFLTVADEANLSAGKLRRGGQRLDMAMLEHDNLRGALAWAVRSGETALGLEIATALEQLWVTDDPAEGVRWFERLLGRPEAAGVPADVRAHALRAFGSSAHISGDPERAARMWEESLALFDELGDEHGRAVLLHRLGISAMYEGRLDLARELVQESDEIHGRTGDVWGRAQTIGTLGAITRDEGDEQAPSRSSSRAQRWPSRQACPGGREACWRSLPPCR